MTVKMGARRRMEEEEEDFEEEDENLVQVRPPGTPNPDDLDTTDDQISQRSEKE